MFFGKYLLDQKIITSSQLVEGMAKQFESQPSLLRLLSESHYLKYEEIVELLEKSIDRNKSLIETLTEDKILTDEQILKLLAERTHKGIGLGQSLINIGHLTTTELDAALKNYATKSGEHEKCQPHEIAPEDIQVAENIIAEPEVTETTEASQDISSAALESLKELGLSTEGLYDEEKVETSTDSIDDSTISAAALESMKELGLSTDEFETSVDEAPATMTFHGLTGEYLSLYDSLLYENFIERIKTLVRGFNSEVLESLKEDLDLLLNASSLAGLVYSEKILSCYSKIFDIILNKEIDFTEFHFMEFGANFKNAMQLSWDLRMELEKSQKEDNLLINDEWKEKFEKTLNKGLLLITEKEAA